MQIIKCLSNLLEKSPTDALLDLAVCALLFNVLMQGYALDVVCDEAYLFTSLNNIMHPNNVRVIDFLQGQYLALHGLPLHAVVQFDFLINFDSTFLHRLLVVTSVHGCVGTLPNGLADLIVIKVSEAHVSYLVEGVLVRIRRPVQEC